MDKFQFLKNIKNKDDRVIISNVLDKYEKYNNTGIFTYTNFLDEKIISMIKNLKIDYNIYKAHDYCEKSIIYFGDYDNYVTIYKIDGKFRHNEILGTLFSLGLDHYTIGDIIVCDDCFFLTNLTRLNSLIENNLYEINNVRVFPKKVDNIIVTKERFTNFNIIVPSYRIDCIVSKLANMGRNETLKFINNGLVLLNYNEISHKKMVKENDIISIRKVGKFIIGKEEKRTKKDNIVLSIKKYN